MTDLELEQKAQLLARDIVQRADDVRRESIDAIPRTVLCSGIVCLSIVVPLCFGKESISGNALLLFRVSVWLMFVAIVCSCCLLLRSIRITNSVIEEMSPVVYSGMWKEFCPKQLRWWEIGLFSIMGISFVGAIALLTLSVMV